MNTITRGKIEKRRYVMLEAGMRTGVWSVDSILVIAGEVWRARGRYLMLEAGMRTGLWSVDSILVIAGEVWRARGREEESGKRLSCMSTLEKMTTFIFKDDHTSLILKVVSSSDWLGSIDSILSTFNVW